MSKWKFKKKKQECCCTCKHCQVRCTNPASKYYKQPRGCGDACSLWEHWCSRDRLFKRRKIW